ncbi:MAG: chromosomal replication initiator protein DnaA [Planctomycetes bacterium]|nr:chromosomal replication initiator protein DnaA [Planctomycetota bacterium]
MSREHAAGNVWQGVLTRIRSCVSEQQFDTWFRSVEPASCSEDVLELTVPNTFSREWLRKKYADIILGAAASANGGRRPTLRITVREGEEPDAGAVAVATAAEPSSHPSGDEGDSASARNPAILIESVLPARPHARASSTPATERTGGAWLNADYRFDSFVVGSGNRLAYAAAMAVVDKEQRIYNPLFVHGGVGLGKSHLLQAICQAWKTRRPDQRVMYVPCEQFINHFIAAVDGGNLDRFRRRYRDADILVMDDVQFLAGKERTQEEFFHTFNHLHQRQKQIVLSAEVPPRGIAGLSERLMSRFRWGMVCELEQPGFETRLDLVRQRGEHLGQQLPDDVAAFIAENVRSHIRELEGAVTRVVGHAHLSGQNVDLALAREALKDLVVERRRRVTIDHIAQAVTRQYGVKLAELQSKKRTQVIALPRQICMFLARRLTGHSLEEVGGFFGGRDHSTVLYGVERIRKKAKDDAALRESVEQLAAQALTIAGS